MFKNNKVQELETKLSIERFVSENKSLVIRELSEANEVLNRINKELEMKNDYLKKYSNRISGENLDLRKGKWEKRHGKSDGILLYREGSTPFGKRYLTLLKIVDGEYQEIDTFENTKTNLKLVKAAGFISDLEYTLDGIKHGVPSRNNENMI